jgi:hypothetical protein
MSPVTGTTLLFSAVSQVYNGSGHAGLLPAIALQGRLASQRPNGVQPPTLAESGAVVPAWPVPHSPVRTFVPERDRSKR